MDASNIIKPALSRGELQCIGATTLNEYRKYIEKDAALERRFQTVKVEAPSVDQTILILKGIRPKYEAHHKARIADDALEAAARLSDRYLTGRFLPDKAIDVMDEAGSRARIAAMTRPPNVKDIEAQIEQIRVDKEAAIKAQDFEKAAALRDSEKQAKDMLDTIFRNGASTRKKEVLSRDDISMSSRSDRRLRAWSRRTPRNCCTWKTSCASASSARTRRSLRSARRFAARERILRIRAVPWVFCLSRPTGVGKTFLARTLAEFMFGDADALIQIDMSEYMEKFTASRLIGSPPGYVGYEEGGQLSEAVRRRPYSVVLFDEIEKAHPDVMHLLLQILEEGKITDSLGRKIDFRNTIIIMTSNVGADLIRKQTTLGFGAPNLDDNYDVMKDKILEETKRVFKPEFLNRLDDTIVFHTLTKPDLIQIVDLEVAKVIQRIKAKNIHLILEESAKDFLIEKGYDPQYGARPMRRAVERYLEDPLAEELLRGNIKTHENIHVKREGEKLAFVSQSSISEPTPAGLS
jgi:ATP-dependent Clp protease ATP-binding subunit ClpC